MILLDRGFALHVDGPGQRLVFYLKGCNMHCLWCALPESISPKPQVLFYAQRVEDPAQAKAACPYRAVAEQEGRLVRDTGRCEECGTFDCTRASRAFELVGYRTEANETLAEALRYRPFFGDRGGVTIGGGEPTCQMAEVAELLAALRGEGIHTALETNGVSPRLPELFENLGLLYIDLKHPDSAACARITGQDNRQVLANIAARHQHGGAMTVRVPVVPGYNTDDAALAGFAGVLSNIGRLAVELVPYHGRGEVKWQALGQEMPAHGTVPPDEALLTRSCERLERAGLQVSVAGNDE